MRNFHSQKVSFAIAAALIAGCGGSGGGGSGSANPPAAQTVQVRLTPSNATVEAGGTVAFAAQVTGTAVTTVSWSVQEAGGGSVAQDGLYTAPATAGTYHVLATSTASSAARASAEVTVTAAPTPTPPSPVVVTVTPATATVDACRGVVLTASVANAADTGVLWSVQEAGGGAVVNGIYTAPADAGTYHVVATSVADGNARGVATMTVGPERVLSVAVTPARVSVGTGAVQSFSATVTTTCGTAPAG